MRRSQQDAMDRVLEKVGGTMQSLTVDMERLRQAMQAEKDSIIDSKQSLQDSVDRFQQEKQRISHVINESEPVPLTPSPSIPSPGEALRWWLSVHDDGHDITQ